MTVFKVIELVGESSKSWDDAVADAVSRACKTVDGLNGVELINMTAKVKDGKILSYKANIKAAFEVED